ncbi:hypothetical protein [Deinococcus navajonensis]|uniref:Uncharacterized protein n=1 Tax=Deinococcus navajonensis TaxID=309884 RepID=A0ABV8XLT6_9DEIO
MTRVLFALAGVVLLAITALAVVWLVGELLAGLGAFVVGASVVLWKLLWFLVLAGVLGGLVFFVTSSWRPATPVANRFEGTDSGRPQAPDLAGSTGVPPGPVAQAAASSTVTERLVYTPDLTSAAEPSSGGPVREEG